jgi:ubiquinone/menaquinone biosynthesis C-methylase UbiE
MPRRTFLPLLAALLLALPLLLARQGAAPAKEQSAKPGINVQWKSTNIEPLIGTLESESREIFHEREKLAALVAPRPGSVVADVGAGSGFMAELFADKVGLKGKVYAVDINAKLLERIAARAKSSGRSNIETVLAREDHSNLPPNSVDLIFLCDTYHHFEYPKSTMRSLYDALRPGGQIVLVEFHRIPGRSPAWLLDHVRAGQDEFTKELRGFGFALVQQHDAPFLTQNYVLRFRKVEKPASLLLPIRPFSAAVFPSALAGPPHSTSARFLCVLSASASSVLCFGLGLAGVGVWC